MRIELCKAEQGSPEWHNSRLGKITASNFSKVITPTGKISSSMNDVINEAVAEILTNTPKEFFITEAMIRGSELEDEAFDYFNLSQDLNLKKSGFVECFSNEGKKYNFGFSPDGEQFKDGFGAEFKCPLAHTHIGYLTDGELPKKYKAQVQGAMALSGVDKWFFGSYHPDLPPLMIWVDRDEDFCSKLLETLFYCHEEINERVNKIKGMQ